jgi:hypothetical protein
MLVAISAGMPRVLVIIAIMSVVPVALPGFRDDAT